MENSVSFVFLFITTFTCCVGDDQSKEGRWTPVTAQLNAFTTNSTWGISGITSIRLDKYYFLVSTMDDCTIHLLDETFRPLTTTRLNCAQPTASHLCLSSAGQPNGYVFAWSQRDSCSGTNLYYVDSSTFTQRFAVKLWRLPTLGLGNLPMRWEPMPLPNGTNPEVSLALSCSIAANNSGCLLVTYSLNIFSTTQSGPTQFLSSRDGKSWTKVWDATLQGFMHVGATQLRVLLSSAQHSVQAWLLYCYQEGCGAKTHPISAASLWLSALYTTQDLPTVQWVKDPYVCGDVVKRPRPHYFTFHPLPADGGWLVICDGELHYATQNWTQSTRLLPTTTPDPANYIQNWNIAPNICCVEDPTVRCWVSTHNDTGTLAVDVRLWQSDNPSNPSAWQYSTMLNQLEQQIAESETRVDPFWYIARCLPEFSVITAVTTTMEFINGIRFPQISYPPTYFRALSGTQLVSPLAKFKARYAVPAPTMWTVTDNLFRLYSRLGDIEEFRLSDQKWSKLGHRGFSIATSGESYIFEQASLVMNDNFDGWAGWLLLDGSYTTDFITFSTCIWNSSAEVIRQPMAQSIGDEKIVGFLDAGSGNELTLYTTSAPLENKCSWVKKISIPKPSYYIGTEIVASATGGRGFIMFSVSREAAVQLPTISSLVVYNIGSNTLTVRQLKEDRQTQTDNDDDDFTVDTNNVTYSGFLTVGKRGTEVVMIGGQGCFACWGLEPSNSRPNILLLLDGSGQMVYKHQFTLGTYITNFNEVWNPNMERYRIGLSINRNVLPTVPIASILLLVPEFTKKETDIIVIATPKNTGLGFADWGWITHDKTKQELIWQRHVDTNINNRDIAQPFEYIMWLSEGTANGTRICKLSGVFPGREIKPGQHCNDAVFWNTYLPLILSALALLLMLALIAFLWYKWCKARKRGKFYQDKSQKIPKSQYFGFGKNTKKASGASSSSSSDHDKGLLVAPIPLPYHTQPHYTQRPRRDCVDHPFLAGFEHTQRPFPPPFPTPAVVPPLSPQWGSGISPDLAYSTAAVDLGTFGTPMPQGGIIPPPASTLGIPPRLAEAADFIPTIPVTTSLAPIAGGSTIAVTDTYSMQYPALSASTYDQTYALPHSEAATYLNPLFDNSYDYWMGHMSTTAPWDKLVISPNPAKPPRIPSPVRVSPTPSSPKHYQRGNTPTPSSPTHKRIT